MDVDTLEPLLKAAGSLGPLFVPAQMNSNLPIISTQPILSAGRWRPFDRRSAIGWHNDFSTLIRRPNLSLSWIQREDPIKPLGGAWKVASVTAMVTRLRQSKSGRKLLAELAHQARPFGYNDSGKAQLFSTVKKNIRGRIEMRFYGRALMEGSQIHFGELSKPIRDIIAVVEDTADQVSEILPATTGALLIVDNRFSLHDRLEQTVTGPKEKRRRAGLCFVQKLYSHFETGALASGSQ